MRFILYTGYWRDCGHSRSQEDVLSTLREKRNGLSVLMLTMLTKSYFLSSILSTADKRQEENRRRDNRSIIWNIWASQHLFSMYYILLLVSALLCYPSSFQRPERHVVLLHDDSDRLNAISIVTRSDVPSTYRKPDASVERCDRLCHSVGITYHPHQ